MPFFCFETFSSRIVLTSFRIASQIALSQILVHGFLVWSRACLTSGPDCVMNVSTPRSFRKSKSRLGYVIQTSRLAPVSSFWRVSPKNWTLVWDCARLLFIVHVAKTCFKLFRYLFVIFHFTILDRLQEHSRLTSQCKQKVNSFFFQETTINSRPIRRRIEKKTANDESSSYVGDLIYWGRNTMSSAWIS